MVFYIFNGTDSNVTLTFDKKKVDQFLLEWIEGRMLQ